MSPNNNKRILVLGSAPHSRSVTAFTWDQVPEHLNIADYDIVIINLIPFINAKFASEHVNSIPSWEQFARLLFSDDSEIIIMGLPEIHYDKHSKTLLMWRLPIAPNYEFNTGEEIRKVNEEFDYYFEHVKKWIFHTTLEFDQGFSNQEQYARFVHPQANYIGVQMRSLAETRFQRSIAFSLRFHAVSTNIPLHYRTAIDTAILESKIPILKTSGTLIWLPVATELNHYEMVNLILRERYGLQLESAPPSWVHSHKLPNQLPIEEEIQRIEDVIKRMQLNLSKNKELLTKETYYQKLLYEQGEDGLEPVVRDTLKSLGANVEEPKKRGKEDGRFITPSGESGVIEIKGRTGTLRLSDVRQLDQWVRDVLAEEELDAKGVLVANLLCDRSLEQRVNVFPDNCIKLANRFEICLLTTTQLFNALVLHQKKELDLNNFWVTIMSTNGVCIIPELESN